MAQPSQVVPTVTLNVSGDKQQVNLRDYLNVRVAPFLKKAIHDSLETEAQFPLQWLGEHLIQQSILHEGNPDATNIRERFVYNHDMAMPKQSASTESTTQSEAVDGHHSTSQERGTTNGNDVPSLPSAMEMQSKMMDDTTTQASETQEHDTEMSGTT